MQREKFIILLSICLFGLSFTICMGQNEQKNFYLKDGTVIQGRVVAQDDSTIVIDTQYGTFDVPKSNVVKEELSKQPMENSAKEKTTTILLKDGTIIKGVVTSESEDTIRVETSYGLMNIPKSNLKPSVKKFIPKTKQSELPIKTNRDIVPSKEEDVITEETLVKGKQYDYIGYWPGKGSTLISGSLNFSVTRVEGYDKSLISLSLVPNAVFFIVKGFGIGFDMNFSFQSQGNTSTTSTALGPEIGGAFGNKESTIIPFLGFGLDYLSLNQSYETTEYSYYTGYYTSSVSNSASGYMLKFSLGIMIKLNEHLGLPIELGILYSNVQSESMTNFVFGVGIAGLLY